MTTIELTDDQFAALSAKALAHGLTLEAWLRQLAGEPVMSPDATSVFDQGLGLFGSPEDAALLDEVVQLAYEDRHRPTASRSVL